MTHEQFLLRQSENEFFYLNLTARSLLNNYSAFTWAERFEQEDTFVVLDNARLSTVRHFDALRKKYGDPTPP